MGVWIRGWRGSNFSVSGLANVGLKNFGAGSVGCVVPKIFGVDDVGQIQQSLQLFLSYLIYFVLL